MGAPRNLEEAYLQRMPPELRTQFSALPDSAREAALKAMVRFHEVMEEETFRLVLGMLQASTK